MKAPVSLCVLALSASAFAEEELSPAEREARQAACIELIDFYDPNEVVDEWHELQCELYLNEERIAEFRGRTTVAEDPFVEALGVRGSEASELQALAWGADDDGVYDVLVEGEGAWGAQGEADPFATAQGAEFEMATGPHDPYLRRDLPPVSSPVELSIRRVNSDLPEAATDLLLDAMGNMGFCWLGESELSGDFALSFDVNGEGEPTNIELSGVELLGDGGCVILELEKVWHPNAHSFDVEAELTFAPTESE